MNRNSPDRYLSEQDLSIAFLAYVSSQLRKKGYRPTRAAIAGEIGVEPSMVSQIYNKDKALHYRTIAQYAHKIGEPVGRVFLEITRRAGEGGSEPSLRTSGRDMGRVLAEAVAEAHDLRDLFLQQVTAGWMDAEWAYGQVVSRTFAVLKRFDLPVRAVVVGVRQGKQGVMFSCKEMGERQTAVVRLLFPVPPNLGRAFEPVGGRRRDLEDDFVVICPGELAYEQPHGKEAEWLEFWEMLTGLTHASRRGTKLRVVAERVLDAAEGGESPRALSMLHFFEHRFAPPADVRQALRVFTWPILQTQIAELGSRLVPALSAAPDCFRDGPEKTTSEGAVGSEGE